MAKPSKELNILELFFNEPTKQWHFSDIKKEVPIADNKISRWLKIFEKEKLINKVQVIGKNPYYISYIDSFEYQIKKKIFALNKFHEIGFLKHISSIKSIKTAIIFGSFSRYDWHKNSDIDLFIYGDDKDFDIDKYSKILNKEIHIFSCKNKGELRKLGEKLLTSIIKGDIVKGDIDFIELKINA
jgi:predicted nucleotidyltransferase